MQPSLEKSNLMPPGIASSPTTETSIPLVPPDAGSLNEAGGSQEVEELRAEMERLRRVVLDLHADRNEPLPTYDTFEMPGP